ncbi:aspartic peptidase domain-containing protein [Cercophora scortea]|uniref:Aspartic peptidase domain-containing protein n=1 Tax=Cercophora scortea TaxID=314031 RepID=A0AAE0IUM1_9PEZI|nr:aspartic peptidase domain-containing protein [Cercophora scortea]
MPTPSLCTCIPIAVYPLVPHTSSRSSHFTVRQIKNPNGHQRNGLHAMIRAYAKFGAELTPAIKTAVRLNPTVNADIIHKRDNTTGSVTTYPPEGNDYEFVSPVQIGTPPQTVYLDFDTGSADLWVFSSETLPFQVNGQAIYTPSASKTSTRVPELSWKIAYGDSSGAAGVVYTDRVAIGNVSVPSQIVESATWVSSTFTADKFCSGLLGLGMTSGSSVKPNKTLTFMDNIRDKLQQPLFTANLKHVIPGTYTFGTINGSEHIGDIQYASVNPDSPYWEFNATGYQVGADGPAVVHNWTAIADTGTTLLLAQQEMVDAYYAQVKGSGFDDAWAAVLFPCETDLPDWSFYIDGYKGTVPGRYMNYGVVNATHCYGGIQTAEGIGFAVFGGTVMKAQFAVFDLGGMRVGFANKVLET